MKSQVYAAVVGAMVALLIAPCSASGAVQDASAGGFSVHNTVLVDRSPEAIWRALTEGFGHWWDPAHSFFGDSGKFTMDVTVGGAWIEDMGDGRWVKHLEVVYVDPGHKLRLRGELGPLQAMGVTGVLTFTLVAQGQGTQVSLDYVVGGYSPAGLDSLAPVVDSVLEDQLNRLAVYLAR